jgi:sugar/nucleoside kinase (ribokinase family)
LLFTQNTNDFHVAMQTGFPDSELLVITKGSKGSQIRLRGTMISIPAYPIKKIIDDTGAGDSYMGIMVGLLSALPYKQWNEDIINKIALTASYGSSLVMQSESSHLTKSQSAETIQMYYQLTRNQLRAV